MFSPTVREQGLLGLLATTDERLQSVTLVGSDELIRTAEQFLKKIDLRQRQVPFRSRFWISPWIMSNRLRTLCFPCWQQFHRQRSWGTLVPSAIYCLQMTPHFRQWLVEHLLLNVKLLS